MFYINGFQYMITKESFLINEILIFNLIMLSFFLITDYSINCINFFILGEELQVIWMLK